MTKDELRIARVIQRGRDFHSDYTKLQVALRRASDLFYVSDDGWFK